MKYLKVYLGEGRRWDDVVELRSVYGYSRCEIQNFQGRKRNIVRLLYTFDVVVGFFYISNPT